MPKKGEDRWFNINSEEADWFGDQSEAIAQGQKLYVDFFHAPSKNSVAFKAFITEYSETFEVNYEEVDAFGRSDPYSKYRNTRRRISLGWETVAGSIQEAEQNMRRCTELIQMMYPSYENSKAPTGVTGMADNPVIAGEPVFRVRFANWLVDTNKGSHEGPGAFAPADFTGLFCLISNLQYTPDLEAGSFDTALGVFPKVIKLSCAIVPFMPEGYWDATSRQKTKDFKFFPFGYDGIRVISEGAPEDADPSDAQQTAAESTMLEGND